MPTIQSRKYPDNVQFVDSETWKLMQEKGLSRRFIVLDGDDIAETIVGTPEQIVEFSDNAPITSTDTVEKVLSRDDIKAELDKYEQEYNTRTSTIKLQEQLNNYLESI